MNCNTRGAIIGHVQAVEPGAGTGARSSSSDGTSLLFRANLVHALLYKGGVRIHKHTVFEKVRISLYHDNDIEMLAGPVPRTTGGGLIGL